MPLEAVGVGLGSAFLAWTGPPLGAESCRRSCIYLCKRRVLGAGRSDPKGASPCRVEEGSLGAREEGPVRSQVTDGGGWAAGGLRLMDSGGRMLEQEWVGVRRRRLVC